MKLNSHVTDDVTLPQYASSPISKKTAGWVAPDLTNGRSDAAGLSMSDVCLLYVPRVLWLNGAS